MVFIWFVFQCKYVDIVKYVHVHAAVIVASIKFFLFSPGKKNFLPPSYLIMGFGFLFKVEVLFYYHIIHHL